LIGEIGVTNFDSAHLRMVIRHGIRVATNQVCFSLLDRRAADTLSKVAAAEGVGLLAFGTLCGGYLSDRWVGAQEPTDIADWSRMKYKRFIDAAGGWNAFQALLRTLAPIARKHGVSVSNLASRWVLDHLSVAATIIGARLGEAEHRDDNLKVFDINLDDEDRAAITATTDRLTPIPGDCGDEYRKPPFLTASGDLSHHLDALPPVFPVSFSPSRPKRSRASSGSVWEAKAGFSRAIRIGDRILVSGTTATDAQGQPVCPGDAEGQTVYILDKILAAVNALGGKAEDIVRTRIYLKDAGLWEPVSAVHARYFGDVLPANTLVAVSGLIGPYAVEVEAEAIVDPDG
jgi:enamine deaminase RidA (YjgF/YER057c/UK114 family)